LLWHGKVTLIEQKIFMPAPIDKSGTESFLTFDSVALTTKYNGYLSKEICSNNSYKKTIYLWVIVIELNNISNIFYYPLHVCLLKLD